MKSILRIALLALVLAAAGVPGAAAAQLGLGDIRWGQSRASVLALFRGLGYELRDETDGGQLYFWSPTGGPSAVAILDPQRRLVAVMMSSDGPADEMRDVHRGVVADLRARFGPATVDSDASQYWSMGEQGVTVMFSDPEPGRPQSTVSVLYNGPGWEAVRDAGPDGQGPAGGLAPLDETRWIVGFQGAGRRVSIDRTRVTSQGNDVYRVWERWEAEEAVRDDEGEWYDASLTRADYDCRGLRMRILEIHTYSRGEVVDDTRIPPGMQSWDSVVPESIGEQTMLAVCPVLRTLR